MRQLITLLAGMISLILDPDLLLSGPVRPHIWPYSVGSESGDRSGRVGGLSSEYGTTPYQEELD